MFKLNRLFNPILVLIFEIIYDYILQNKLVKFKHNIKLSKFEK